jgi:membrane associated rhomboid family serine protease
MNDLQPENASEYSRDASPRQARARGSSTNRLRATFFAVAALWGFIAGAGALAAGYRIAGHPGTVDGVVLGVAIPGAILAALGGLVAAGAYREARDRRRR